MAIRRRHKGERPIDRSQSYMPYGPDHPVALAIATGSRWFDAWHHQSGLPYVKLARLSGIEMDRLFHLSYGYPVRHSELLALAAAYGVQPSDIIASLPDLELLIRGA
ncbi:hypothetical protein SAMN02927924_01656 [Sphingobium faniae]|nr:hypothetical protein SAMN02927924_01656 [Sphingobium faniae]